MKLAEQTYEYVWPRLPRPACAHRGMGPGAEPNGVIPRCVLESDVRLGAPAKNVIRNLEVGVREVARYVAAPEIAMVPRCRGRPARTSTLVCGQGDLARQYCCAAILSIVPRGRWPC